MTTPQEQPDGHTKGLIERLEAAEVGSRELSEAMLSALGFVTKRYPLDSDTYWIVPGDDRHPLPAIFEVCTTSLDAALSLAEQVLPGWLWQIDIEPTRSWVQGASEPWPEGLVASDRGGVYQPADTPALALCAAILRAKEQAS